MKASGRREGIRGTRGFTLIELVVVVAIIAMLAGILAPVAASAIKKSKAARCGADLKALGTSIVMIYEDVSTFDFANDNCGLGHSNLNDSIFRKNPCGASGWNGPYYKGNISSPYKTDYKIYSHGGSDMQDSANCNGIGLENVTSRSDAIGRDVDEIVDDGDLGRGTFHNGCWGAGHFAFNLMKNKNEP
jgi:general secretion pathway protein G